MLITLVLLVACDSDYNSNSNSGQPPAAVTPAQAQASAVLRQTPDPDFPHAVSGQVFDAYSGALGDTVVGFFVETSRMGRGADVRTDQNGRFTAYVPDSKIRAFVVKAASLDPEWVQPCAVQAEVRGSIDLQVEVVSSATLQSLSPPRPQLVRGVTLTGTIFETIDGVRSPVTGALLWAEEYDDIALATTLSDFQGGYFLCNLPRRIGLYVTKSGFVTPYLSINPEETPTVDIELRRR